MGIGALFMTVFAIDQLCARPLPDIVRGFVAVAIVAGLYLAWDYLSPSSVPSAGTLMMIGFFPPPFCGVPVRLSPGPAALLFLLVEGAPARRVFPPHEGP